MNNERGSVSVIFLILFAMISIFLIALLKLTSTDYTVVAKSLEDLGIRAEDKNVMELVKSDLVKDILHERSLEEIQEEGGWAIYEGVEEDYRLEYVGESLGEVKKALLNKEALGSWYFEKFRNYEEIHVEDMEEEEIEEQDLSDYRVIRKYSVKDNWLEGNENVGYGFYKEIAGRGFFTMPESVYVMIKFDNKVSRINLELGNDFEKKNYEILNSGYGKGGENLYVLKKLDKLPPSVSEFNIRTTDNFLGSTEFMLLSGRDVRIEVIRSFEQLDRDDKVVRRDVLKVGLGEGKNILR